MASYLSLEEAAAKLGIPTERLVELRSQGDVRGFRDGSSWKFPDTEIDRLAEELGEQFGSGILVDDRAGGSGVGSKIIGGDASSSDLGLGDEPSQPGSGSDVNLVTTEGNGSDVALVASGSDLGLEDDSADELLLEIDSADLQLNDPAIMHDSAQLDLASELKDGSTGPIQKKAAESAVDLGTESVGSSLGEASDLSFAGILDDDDSGEDIIGDSDDDHALDSDVDLNASGISGASSLELMLDLDSPGSSVGESGGSADVLGELDLMSAEQGGSGLISGDSADNLLGSSGIDSDIGSGIDDALGDDDDLVIADDDDDLIISSAGSDISIAGDSGINLMSPSDSGLSLESEPLDLAGSSISALDLGAESGVGSSKSGIGSGSGPGDGSAVDFQADEEFQLSPSGIGFEVDDSGSQVIEVEDSAAIAEPVEFGDAAFGDADPAADPFASDGGAFAEEGEAVEAFEDDGAIALDHDDVAASGASVGMMGYEIPFTLMQVVALVMIICIMSLGGMLMTDLVRNMWAYTEPSAPVSSLTDSLIQVMGFTP